MNELLFQNIFDKIQEFLPTEWEKVVFYAGYTEGSYSMKYYTDCGDGKYIDCFSQSYNMGQLLDAFSAINKEISAERNALKEPRKWTVLTMIVNSDGQMKAEFDYKDISDDTIEYEREWKKKYL